MARAYSTTYARMLVEAGLILGVCEYGYCVYRREYSACRGNAAGPNPVHREPSTCARCKNFAVSTQHRPYWLDQMRRCEALLHEPALPTQTLKIVRERLEEGPRHASFNRFCQGRGPWSEDLPLRKRHAHRAGERLKRGSRKRWRR